jgi:hypothetical protein
MYVSPLVDDISRCCVTIVEHAGHTKNVPRSCVPILHGACLLSPQRIQQRWPSASM